MAFRGTAMTEQPAGQLGAFVSLMKQELGSDPDLVKQAVADLHALERQNAHNYF